MFKPLINTDVAMPDDVFDALLIVEAKAIGMGLEVVDQGFVEECLATKDVDPSEFKAEFLYPG